MSLQFIEREGKTVEEALEIALEELKVGREQVNVKVLDEGSKGIFGLGAKPTKIRVTLKEDPSKTPEGILSKLLEYIGIEGSISSDTVDGTKQLTVATDDSALLIGKHGQTLDAVQYLLNCILNKSALVKKKVVVNTENYRERREEMLIELAYRLASKVKRTGQELVMNPMPPHERRIIHVTLQNDDKVRTFSRGDGPERCVVITTKERFERERYSSRDRFADDGY